jgi:GTP-binding protein HflX
MPRLIGKGVMLSRLGGGIGTRGPGEQKLEMDRRRIRARITRLGEELEKLARRRQATRSRRRETHVPVAALVGYTNAGKTTLLNRLTGAAATAQDQLFTTLDPLARRMRLPDGEIVIVTDTVGFLHELPHHLIEAFQATLEEARDADLLLHVLDLSHPLLPEHAVAVGDVLRQLKLDDKPVLTVLNKRDRFTDVHRIVALERFYEPAIAISAKTGEGMDRLSEAIAHQLGFSMIAPIRLHVPPERSDLIAFLYRTGHVLQRNEMDGAVELIARIPAPLKAALSPYIVS